MRRIFILLALVFSFVQGFSQGGNDPNKYTWYRYLYGNRTARIWADTVNNVPSDTIYSKDGIARIESTLYVGNGTKWTATASGIIDTSLFLRKPLVTGGASDSIVTVSNGVSGKVAQNSISGAATLQSVTNAGNQTTNDITVGSRSLAAGRISVEKTYTSLDVHSFDDYSTLNPSSGGFGFGVFDASTIMSGIVNNDHFQSYQSRLRYTASGNLNGIYGMVGLYVRNFHNGSGTITNAHGIYIDNVGEIGSSGTVTNAYGLRIKPVTSGTSLNYAIMSEGGLNSFAGASSFGSSITAAGTIAATGTNSIVSYGAGSPSALTNALQMVMQQDGTNSIFYTIGRGSNSSNIGNFLFNKFNGTTATEMVRIKASNGFVGIGHSNPPSKLSVLPNANSVTGLTVWADNNFNNNIVELLDINGIKRMTVNPYGWMSINKNTAPAQVLHVGGQVMIDTILTGSSADSVLTTVNGVIKKVPNTLPIAGAFSGVGTATTTFTVTIGPTMANTTYKVNATPTAALSAALFYVTNKTTTTFDVVYLAGLTGTVTFDWAVFP
jgi:hypothetical protein